MDIRSRRGMTLLEILVSVAMLGILVTIIAGAFLRGMDMTVRAGVEAQAAAKAAGLAENALSGSVLRPTGSAVDILGGFGTVISRVEGADVSVTAGAAVVIAYRSDPTNTAEVNATLYEIRAVGENGEISRYLVAVPDAE